MEPGCVMLNGIMGPGQAHGAYRLQIAGDSNCTTGYVCYSYQNVKEAGTTVALEMITCGTGMKKGDGHRSQPGSGKHIGDRDQIRLEAYLNDAVTSTAGVEDINTGELDALDTQVSRMAVPP